MVDLGVDLGLVDVDTCPGAAAVENDVVFGGGVVGVESVEEKEEEEEKEEDEDQEEEEEEVFAANRIGKLNRFGFGETGGGEVGVVDVVVGSGAMAMFEVMAIGGEILEGGGDSEVVVVVLAKDHVEVGMDLVRLWSGSVHGVVASVI